MSTEIKEPEMIGRKGAKDGLVTGTKLMGCLLVAGFLLSLTGIGAIIGLPMILAAFGAPILLPILGYFGLMEMRGICPYCGEPVALPLDTKGFTCPTCKKRILRKDNTLTRVE